MANKDQDIHLRVTPEQKRVMAEAAQRSGVSLSSWLVSLALRETSKLVLKTKK